MAYAVAQRLLAADNPDYEAVDIERGGPVAIRGGEGTGDHLCALLRPGSRVITSLAT